MNTKEALRRTDLLRVESERLLGDLHAACDEDGRTTSDWLWFADCIMQASAWIERANRAALEIRE